MNDKLLHPYRLDTNPRYREVIKFCVTLALAAISIPIFFARNILVIPEDLALLSIFDWRVFTSWALSIITILASFVFYYASATWIRLAWGLEARIFGLRINDAEAECILDWSFWFALISVAAAFGLILWFMVSYEFKP